jgi:hypothetical protein
MVFFLFGVRIRPFLLPQKHDTIDSEVFSATTSIGFVQDNALPLRSPVGRESRKLDFAKGGDLAIYSGDVDSDLNGFSFECRYPISSLSVF